MKNLKVITQNYLNDAEQLKIKLKKSATILEKQPRDKSEAAIYKTTHNCGKSRQMKFGQIMEE